jgi:hypothetical protein
MAIGYITFSVVRIVRENVKYSEEDCPGVILSTALPRDLTRDRIRTTVVGIRQ